MVQKIVIRDPFHQFEPIVLNYEEWEYEDENIDHMGRGYCSDDRDELFVPAIFDQQLPDVDELIKLVSEVNSNMNEVEMFEE